MVLDYDLRLPPSRRCPDSRVRQPRFGPAVVSGEGPLRETPGSGLEQIHRKRGRSPTARGTLETGLRLPRSGPGKRVEGRPSSVRSSTLFGYDHTVNYATCF